MQKVQNLIERLKTNQPPLSQPGGRICGAVFQDAGLSSRTQDYLQSLKYNAVTIWLQTPGELPVADTSLRW